MRINFNPASIDNQYYFTTGVRSGRLRPGIETYETLFDYTNAERTRMKFRIDLRELFGKDYEKCKYVKIRLTDVKAMFDANQNSDTINHVSPGWIRSSNLYMVGQKCVNGTGQHLFGLITNYDPNEETQYYLEFHRGDLIWNGQYVLYLRCQNGGLANWDGIEFGHNIVATHAAATPLDVSGIDVRVELQNKRWRWNYREQHKYSPTTHSDTNPSLENQTITITDGVLPSNGWMVLQYETSAFENQALAGSNFGITLTQLPSFPNWYNFKRNTSQIDDHQGNDAYIHKPDDNYLDFELQIRDILTDKIQPVLETTLQIPPFTFIFDIEII